MMDLAYLYRIWSLLKVRRSPSDTFGRSATLFLCSASRLYPGLTIMDVIIVADEIPSGANIRSLPFQNRVIPVCPWVCGMSKLNRIRWDGSRRILSNSRMNRSWPLPASIITFQLRMPPGI